MGVNHGEGGRVPNAILSPRFCHFSKFQASYCLHYNAVKSVPTPLFQKYIFNVHQSPLWAEVFLLRAQTKIPLRIHLNTPFQVKYLFFSGRSLVPSSDPSHVRKSTPSPHLTRRLYQTWIRLCVPRIPARFMPLLLSTTVSLANGNLIGSAYPCD